MAACPHDCLRCRVIEAGHDPGHGLSSQQFVEIFGLVEQERERAPLADDTLEAIAAEEVARIAFDRAHGDVSSLVFTKGRKDDPELEEALLAATKERSDAAKRHNEVRARMHALVLRDQELWRAERRLAKTREREKREAAERAAQRKKGRSLIRKFRGS